MRNPRAGSAKRLSLTPTGLTQGCTWGWGCMAQAGAGLGLGQAGLGKVFAKNVEKVHEECSNYFSTSSLQDQRFTSVTIYNVGRCKGWVGLRLDCAEVGWA